MLNGLPWKRTEIILLFLRLHPRIVFQIFLLTVRVFRFFYGILAHSNIWWSYELNLPVPVHFSSLIPKMSLLLSPAVTTSSTPWFMDLTFQVSMQWCSVQHQMCFHHQTHPQLSIVSTLVQPLHSFWCAKSLQSFPTFCDPMDCSPPGSSVHGLSRQEHWSELPFPPPVDLPDPGIEPTSLMSDALAGIFFTTEPPFFLELLVIALSSSLVTYWTPSNLGDSSSGDLFAFSYCSWGSLSKNARVVCRFLLQSTTFCQNSSLWLIRLGWPCMSWLIASLSYTSPSITSRLWSMKGARIIFHCMYVPHLFFFLSFYFVLGYSRLTMLR